MWKPNWRQLGSHSERTHPSFHTRRQFYLLEKAASMGELGTINVDGHLPLSKCSTVPCYLKDSTGRRRKRQLQSFYVSCQRVFSKREGHTTTSSSSLKQPQQLSGIHELDLSIYARKNDKVTTKKRQNRSYLLRGQALLGIGVPDLDNVYDVIDEDGLDLQAKVDKPRLRRPTKKSSANARKLGLVPWGAKEEERLLELVGKEQLGEIGWQKIAEKMNRSGVGCMTKYYSLKPAMGE